MNTDQDQIQAAALSHLCVLHKLRAEHLAGTALAELKAAEREVAAAREIANSAQIDWRAVLNGPRFDPVLAGLQGQTLHRCQIDLKRVAGLRDEADSANDKALAALAVSRSREDVAKALLDQSRAAVRRKVEDRLLAAAEDILSRKRCRR